ncbi:MAG: FliH/SctL family protein [Halarsenatibacteraceae bacterium]
MSKVIKSSQITGEYKLSDTKALEKKRKKADKMRRKLENNSDEIKSQKEEILSRARKDADEILAEAQEEAALIINKAKEKKQEIYNQAEEKAKETGYQEGFKEGQKLGEEAIKEEFEVHIDSLHNILANVEAEIEHELNRMPLKVTGLSIDIAEKIVQASLELDPELISPIVKDCLDQVGIRHNRVEIRVCPELIDVVADITGDYKGKFELELIGDESLEPGDCLIETEFGGKDATLDNKLKQLRKELIKEVANGEST